MANNIKKSNKPVIIISIIVVILAICAVVLFVFDPFNWQKMNTNIDDDTREINDTTDAIISEETTTTIVTTEAPNEEIEFTKTPVNSNAELSGGGEAELSINYPKLSSNYYGEKCEGFNQIVSTYVDAFKDEYAKALSNDSYANADAISFQMDYEVYRQETGIISLLLKEDVFLGGAHSSTIYRAINYSIDAEKSMSISDMLGVDSQTYNDFFVTKILERIKSNPDDYFEMNEESLREVYNESNFYLTDNGITIFFQEYEIAPYAEGLQLFEFTWSSDLVDILPY